MHDLIDRALSELAIHPVLVDVGASGGAPALWKPIARRSIYLGFDPDTRELHQTADGAFFKSIIMDTAVSVQRGAREVQFYLTQSPSCSSTLRPDCESLSNFLFSDLFKVKEEKTVAAESLGETLDRFSLDRIDWLKLDTQGTDLRIWKSLPPNLRSQVLAIDIEPGLIDAYIGEDLFVDTHRTLLSNGFWLSNLNVRGAVRVQNATVHKAVRFERRIADKLGFEAIKRSPAWCEARYLRTCESLEEVKAPKRDYVLLWIFALLDGQLGFALDVAMVCERLFNEDDIARLMREETLKQINRASWITLPTMAKRILPRGMKRWLKRYMQQHLSSL